MGLFLSPLDDLPPSPVPPPPPPSYDPSQDEATLAKLQAEEATSLAAHNNEKASERTLGGPLNAPFGHLYNLLFTAMPILIIAIPRGSG